MWLAGSLPPRKEHSALEPSLWTAWQPEGPGPQGKILVVTTCILCEVASHVGSVESQGLAWIHYEWRPSGQIGDLRKPRRRREQQALPVMGGASWGARSWGSLPSRGKSCLSSQAHRLPRKIHTFAFKRHTADTLHLNRHRSIR